MNAITEIGRHFAAVSERNTMQAVHAAALRLYDDHELAIAENARRDAERETERQRLQGCADQHRADNLPRPESCCARDARIDSGDELELTDEEIIAFGAECGMGLAELVTRLEKFTEYARAELLVAA